MSFTFEIGETRYENLANGDYLVVLKGIEEKINEYGTYIQIVEQVDGGRMRYQKFNVGHTDEKKRATGIKDFSTFCSQLTGLTKGQKVNGQHLLNKKYILTILNIQFENGNVFEKAVKRVLVEAPPLVSPTDMQAPNTMQYGGIGIPQQPAASNQPLNDDVPF